MENAFWKNVVLALDFEKQYRLSRFLSKNDAKRIFHQRRRFDLEKQFSNDGKPKKSYSALDLESETKSALDLEKHHYIMRKTRFRKKGDN